MEYILLEDQENGENPIKSRVDEAINLFQASVTNKNLGDLGNLSKEVFGMANKLSDNKVEGLSSNPEEAEKAEKYWKSEDPEKYEESRNPGIQEFRDLIESKKTQIRDFRISKNPKTPGIQDFTKSGELKISNNSKDPLNSVLLDSNDLKNSEIENTDYAKKTLNGYIRDPRESSNLYETFKISEDNTISKSSGNICLEEDSEELQAEIVKNTQTHLGRQIAQSINMSVLDDIAKQTYQLEGELKLISSIKYDTFGDIDASFKAAERALEMERKSQIEKFLEELLKVLAKDDPQMAADFVDPTTQKNYRDARLKLCKALELFRRMPDLREPEMSKLAEEAALDGLTLWPKLKEDSRAIHLMDKLLVLSDS